MGQKINPIGLRLGINRTWDSRWFAGKGDFTAALIRCGMSNRGGSESNHGCQH